MSNSSKPTCPSLVLQIALEAQEDFYRLMARGKLGQTGFRQWLRTSAYSIQQVLPAPKLMLRLADEHAAQVFSWHAEQPGKASLIPASAHVALHQLAVICTFSSGFPHAQPLQDITACVVLHSCLNMVFGLEGHCTGHVHSHSEAEVCTCPGSCSVSKLALTSFVAIHDKMTLCFRHSTEM